MMIGVELAKREADNHRTGENVGKLGRPAKVKVIEPHATASKKNKALLGLPCSCAQDGRQSKHDIGSD